MRRGQCRPKTRSDRVRRKEGKEKKNVAMGHASCTCIAHAYYPSPFAHRERWVLLAQERERERERSEECVCLDSTAVRFTDTPMRITTNHMGSFFFTSTDHVHSPHADIMPFYNIHILLLGNFTTVNVSSGPLSGKVIKVCLTLTISIYFCPNHLSSPEFHNLANKKITNPHILHSA